VTVVPDLLEALTGGGMPSFEARQMLLSQAVAELAALLAPEDLARCPAVRKLAAIHETLAFDIAYAESSKESH
jgi:hypothetical protein